MAHVGSDCVPIFLYGVIAQENRHDTLHMTNVMEDAIQKYTDDKITAIITDIHIVMVNAGETVQRKYDNIVHIRCASHSIHLLIGKVIDSQTCQKYIREFKDVVKCIKNKSVPYAVFNNKKGILHYY